MLSRVFLLRWFLVALIALTAFSLAPAIASAQDAEAEEELESEDEESHDEEGETEAAPVPGRTGSGAPAESWIAMGVALGLGAATIVVGAIIGRLALDQNAVALDPRSTQIVAQSTHRTGVDFALASTVTLTIGGIIFGIGAVWAIVLPFSTPPGTALRATLSPSSVGLEGTF